MLDIWAINIVVPTTGTDMYGRVAINEKPIIILGRESDVRNILARDLVDYIKSKITPRLWDEAVYSIIQIRRLDGLYDRIFHEWKASDITHVDFE